MKKILSLVLAMGLTFSLIGCGSQSTNSDISAKEESSEKSKLEEVKEKGYITVATSPDYPPFEFITIENGKQKTVGFDISIAEEIAKDLGVELKLKEMSFEGLLLELEAGNVDMVMAGLTPTEERVEVFDFSDIYYSETQAILIRSEDADKYASLEDFSGKKVGVQLTSIQEKIAKEQMSDANITSLSKLTSIIMDLINGNIDACIVESVVAQGYVSQYPELAISYVELEGEEEGSAIAIKKGNEDLVEAINETINRLKNEGMIDKFMIEANELVGK